MKSSCVFILSINVTLTFTDKKGTALHKWLHCGDLLQECVSLVLYDNISRGVLGTGILQQWFLHKQMIHVPSSANYLPSGYSL